MVDDLQKKREADRRSALLGLAADRSPGEQGRCLSVQEMSALLDGKCSTHERQRFLVHLSSCDSCYREWVALDHVLYEKQAGKKKRFIFQPSFLALSGSLLAAAVSVLFFMNLDYSPGPEKAALPSPSPELQMEATGEKSEKRRLPGREQKGVPAPASLEKKVEPHSLSRQAGEAVKGVTTPMEEDAVHSFSAADEQAAPALPQSASPAGDPVRQWLYRVEEDCRSRSSGQAGWFELARQGDALVLTDQHLDLSAIVKHVHRLAQGEDQAWVCVEIQRILAESRKE